MVQTQHMQNLKGKPLWSDCKLDVFILHMTI